MIFIGGLMRKKVGKEFFYTSDINIPDNNFSFFSKRLDNFMNISNFPQQFFPIVALFAEDCNYNINELHTIEGELRISGSYKKNINRLYLSYNNERHYLTVIQVMFINRRQGNMTKLLDILKIIKETYKLNRIMIQSPLNEAMRNWCRKNEFIQNKSDESEYIMI
jgi:hypothetical protein